MKRQVYAKRHKTVRALKAAVKAAWKEVPDRMLRKLMASFSKRLKKCVECNGGHTGY